MSQNFEKQVEWKPVSNNNNNNANDKRIENELSHHGDFRKQIKIIT